MSERASAAVPCDAQKKKVNRVVPHVIHIHLPLFDAEPLKAVRGMYSPPKPYEGAENLRGWWGDWLASSTVYAKGEMALTRS